jgi:hypothetical protein
LVGSTYFEKPANTWQVPDIDKLAGIEEGIYLEFKKPSELLRNEKYDRDKFTKELTETVSAFLNSIGGVILVGVQTDKHRKDRKTEFLKSIDTWVSDQTFERLGISLTASQIRDLIYGNIMPKPIGVEVKDLDISVGEATTTVFVVTVAASPLGAHQSVKTRHYYRRTADNDEPMLDFEIRDVNSRRAGPLLHLACRVSDTADTLFEEEWKSSSIGIERISREDRILRRVILLFATLNLGRGTADIARFDIGIPNPWNVQRIFSDGTDAGAHWVEQSGLQFTLPSKVTVFWEPNKCNEIPHPYRNQKLAEQVVAWKQVVYSGSESPAHPIWPTSDRKVIARLRLHRPNEGDDVPFSWLPWRAFSGNMLETRGAILLREDDDQLYITNYDMDVVTWWHQAEDLQKFEELKQRFQVS